jgi:hypothetical protein
MLMTLLVLALLSRIRRVYTRLRRIHIGPVSVFAEKMS